jgi:small GTP-binding protein
MDILKYKVLLLGPPAVGKTSLWDRFINKSFKEDYAMTIGVQVSTRDITFRNAIVKLTVWDIGGQARFKDLRKKFYFGTEGALLIFDLTREETFKEIEGWLKEVNDLLPYNIPFVLIGNKMDLIKDGRKLNPQEAKTFAQIHNSLYLETSAKTGDGVKDAFKELILKIVKIKNLKV